MEKSDVKPKLLYQKDLDVYGIYYYYSSYNAYKLDDKEVRKDVRHVVAFKKHGKHVEGIKRLVEYIMGKLQCEIIVPLPSSSTRLNTLQELYGSGYIKRIKSVEQRKYDHKKKIENSELKTLQINHEALSGKKILLLDDVITTGETIRFFREALKNHDIKVLTIGLNYRLKPEIIEYITLPDESTANTMGENSVKREFEDNLSHRDIMEITNNIKPGNITFDIEKISEHIESNYGNNAGQVFNEVMSFLELFQGAPYSEIKKNMKLSAPELAWIKKMDRYRKELEKALGKPAEEFDFIEFQ